MSIDGVGGPKGPEGPQTPEGLDSPDRVEGTDEVAPGEESFVIAGAEPTGSVDAPQAIGDPTIAEAVKSVIDDLRAGRVEGLDAAFDAVIERIVETRYTGMSVRSRQRFTRHLQQLLADDPGVGAAISQILERASQAD